MMTIYQERLVRRLLKSGGKLSLPGKQGLIQLNCTRTNGQLDIQSLTVTEGAFVVTAYSSWQSRDLYPDVAELLDKLTLEQEVAA